MADKTEAPTPRRKEQAREKGQVAHSIELNAAAIMFVGAILISGPARTLAQQMGAMMTQMLLELPKVELSDNYLKQTAYQYIINLGPSLGMVLGGLLVTGVAVTVAQTGFLWSSKKIGFDFSRVNPINGFKRIFSARGLIEMLRSLLKLVVIGWVAYDFIKANIPQLMMLSQYDLGSATSVFFETGISLAMRVGSIYLILAVADYAYQRWDLMRNLRMSKDEIKEEYKQSEGDPFMKSRIRSQMRRMARSRMMSNVPKATVVVTNPTHLAIAIEYRDGMNAPRVLAKGAHHTAERIVAVARKNNIPVVQNIPLARAIYKRIDIDKEIPPDLYLAMAEVLAYVYRIRGKYAFAQRQAAH
jgi:flagellar biosynthetic protein FlhB